MWINRPTPTIPDWSRPDLFIGEPPLLIISQPTKNCKLPMHHTKKSAHALSPIWSQCPLKAALPPKALVQHPNFSHPSHVLSIYISLSLPLIVGHPHTHTHCMHASKCMRCICTGPFEVRGGPTAHMACPPSYQLSPNPTIPSLLTSLLLLHWLPQKKKELPRKISQIIKKKVWACRRVNHGSTKLKPHTPTTTPASTSRFTGC